jgi:hypothetical protein
MEIFGLQSNQIVKRRKKLRSKRLRRRKLISKLQRRRKMRRRT